MNTKKSIFLRVLSLLTVLSSVNFFVVQCKPPTQRVKAVSDESAATTVLSPLESEKIPVQQQQENDPTATNAELEAMRANVTQQFLRQPDVEQVLWIRAAGTEDGRSRWKIRLLMRGGRLREILFTRIGHAIIMGSVDEFPHQKEAETSLSDATTVQGVKAVATENKDADDAARLAKSQYPNATLLRVKNLQDGNIEIKMLDDGRIFYRHYQVPVSH